VSSAAAGSENTTPRNIVQANAFCIMALLPNSVLLDGPNEVAPKL
jgi:hypothetical protein